MNSLEANPEAVFGLAQPNEPPAGLVRLIALYLARREMAALLAVTPLLLWPGPWSMVALLIIGALWVCHAVALGRLTRPDHIDIPIGLLALLALVGLYVSPDAEHSLPALYRLALGLALFYGLLRTITDHRAVRRALASLSIGGAALALVALFTTDWTMVRLFPSAIYAHLPRVVLDPGDRALFNPRIVGMALALFLPFPLAALWLRRSNWDHLLHGLSALAIVATLILTQAPQALAGLLAGLPLLVAWRGRRALLTTTLALAVPLGAVLWWLDPQQALLALLSMEHPLGRAVLLRLDIWSRALAMLRDMPFTGIGLDAFPLIQTHFYTGMYLGPEPHAHNLYLQIALDLGLPGLAVFVALLALLARELLRAWRRRPAGELRALLAASSASLTVLLGSGWLDTLWAAKPGVLCWVLLGLTAAACRLSIVPDPQRRLSQHNAADRRLPGRALRATALAVFATTALLFCTTPGAVNRALIQVHRGVIAVRLGSDLPAAALRPATHALERAAARTPVSASVWRTLGTAQAWLGENEAALACFAQAVALDAPDPLRHYAPFELWACNLRGETAPHPSQALLRVYNAWLRRYPQRAEGYVQAALAWERHEAGPAQATAALEEGLALNANPRALLLHSLGHRREAGP